MFASVIDLDRVLSRLSASLPDLIGKLREAIPGGAWLVGGFVRDLYLRRQPYDLDLTVEGDAAETASKLAAALGGHWFPLAEERGTFRVALREGEIRTVDVAGLRGGGIEEDLRLRDFTVDAMAFPLFGSGRAALVDPFGGLNDLQSKSVRMVSARALADDPLRMLRAVRLAVELDFEIESETQNAIHRAAPQALKPAAERQRDELMRILASGQAARGLRLLDSLGLLEVLLAEVARGKGVSQPPKYHYFDVFDHCIQAVAVTDWLLGDGLPAGRKPRALRREFWRALGWYPLSQYFGDPAGGHTRLALTQLATLLHDVSKPETRSVDEDGRVRFLGHSEQGARVAANICSRFRLGNKESGFVTKLVEEHLRPAQLSQSGLPSDRAVFRFFRSLGEAAPACLVLSLTDAAAAIGPRLTPSRWRAHVAYAAYVLQRGTVQEQTLSGRHFVSGDTLIQALGLPPGPEIGRLLAAIDEAAGVGEVETKEQAIQLATRLRESWPRSRTTGAGIA